MPNAVLLHPASESQDPIAVDMTRDGSSACLIIGSGRLLYRYYRHIGDYTLEPGQGRPGLVRPASIPPPNAPPTASTPTNPMPAPTNDWVRYSIGGRVVAPQPRNPSHSQTAGWHGTSAPRPHAVACAGPGQRHVPSPLPTPATPAAAPGTAPYGPETVRRPPPWPQPLPPRYQAQPGVHPPRPSIQAVESPSQQPTQPLHHRRSAQVHQQPMLGVPATVTSAQQAAVPMTSFPAAASSLTTLQSLARSTHSRSYDHPALTLDPPPWPLAQRWRSDTASNASIPATSFTNPAAAPSLTASLPATAAAGGLAQHLPPHSQQRHPTLQPWSDTGRRELHLQLSGASGAGSSAVPGVLGEASVPAHGPERYEGTLQRLPLPLPRVNPRLPPTAPRALLHAARGSMHAAYGHPTALQLQPQRWQRASYHGQMPYQQPRATVPFLPVAPASHPLRALAYPHGYRPALLPPQQQRQNDTAVTPRRHPLPPAQPLLHRRLLQRLRPNYNAFLGAGGRAIVHPTAAASAPAPARLHQQPATARRPAAAITTATTAAAPADICRLRYEDVFRATPRGVKRERDSPSPAVHSPPASASPPRRLPLADLPANLPRLPPPPLLPPLASPLAPRARDAKRRRAAVSELDFPPPSNLAATAGTLRQDTEHALMQEVMVAPTPSTTVEADRVLGAVRDRPPSPPVEADDVVLGHAAAAASSAATAPSSPAELPLPAAKADLRASPSRRYSLAPGTAAASPATGSAAAPTFASINHLEAPQPQLLPPPPSPPPQPPSLSPAMTSAVTSPAPSTPANDY